LTLAPAQGENLGARRMSFHLPAAAFERVLTFLEALRAEGGWQVGELRLAKVSPNMVNVDVVLIRE
jgi:type II secretory pathway component PulM